MVGENGKNQTGQFKDLEQMNSIPFGKELFVVGYYHYILNIVVRQSCRAAFVSKGDTHDTFNSYIIKLGGFTMKSSNSISPCTYNVLNLLIKELPLPQTWIETRWEYIHNHMQWYTKYEEPCVSLAKHMVSWLRRSDCHLSVWKEIIKMSSSPMIQVERSFLA